MYRDDKAAANERILALEDQLTAKTDEIQALRAELKRRDEHIGSILSSFNRRRGTAYRRWQILAMGAVGALVALLVLTAIRGQAANRGTFYRERKETGESPLLADPIHDVSRAIRGERSDAAPPAMSGFLAPLKTCPPDDPLCRATRTNVVPSPRDDLEQEKAELLQKLANGTATISELRVLKSLCMLDGDRACRAAAVSALRLERSIPTEGNP